jgi:hypothetical protein
MRSQWNTAPVTTNLQETLKKRLLAIAAMMVRDIKLSMKSYGQYSMLDTGKTVRGARRTKSGKRHYPSMPGEPPAVDYGRLRASISFNWSGSGIGRANVGTYSDNWKTKVKTRQKSSGDGMGEPPRGKDMVRVVVGTNIEYGLWLELGTSRMAARPFIRPILEKYRPRIMSLIISNSSI